MYVQLYKGEKINRKINNPFNLNKTPGSRSDFIFILNLKTLYSKHNFAYPKLKKNVGSEKVTYGAYMKKANSTKPY